MHDAVEIVLKAVRCVHQRLLLEVSLVASYDLQKRNIRNCAIERLAIHSHFPSEPSRICLYQRDSVRGKFPSPVKKYYSVDISWK